MRSRLLVLLLVFAACTAPPKAGVTRAETPVNASFARTWDATVGIFAERNVPIKTIDRSSGFIGTDALRVNMRTDSLADCGTDVNGLPIRATMAEYNVLIHGDSTHSTVRVSMHWSSPTGPYDCTTKGVWESALETEIKHNAETQAATTGH